MLGRREQGRTFTRVENALEEKANDVQDALNRLTLARLVPHLRKNLVEIGLRKFQRLRKPHARTKRRNLQRPSSAGAAAATAASTAAPRHTHAVCSQEAQRDTAARRRGGGVEEERLPAHCAFLGEKAVMHVRAAPAHGAGR